MSVANLLNATSGGLSQGCWKRKGSEEEDDVSESGVKKAKYSWYVTLESESSQHTSSDEEDESVHSVQAQETEYARDTSDTSTNTWSSSATSEDGAVEYDVASLSEDENPLLASLSTSDSEHIIRVGMIAADVYQSDVVPANDESDDSKSSRDSEIFLADFRTCLQCSTINNNPLFPYCEKCYQYRKNFFPPRPRGRKRRPKKTSKSKTNVIEIAESHELTTADSGLGLGSICLSQSSDLCLSQPGTSSLSPTIIPPSQEFASTTEKYDDDRSSRTMIRNEDEKLSQESLESVATTVEMSFSQDSGRETDETKTLPMSGKKLQLPDEPANDLCLICAISPRNGVLVHGRTAHTCCCYRCAKKIWKTTRHCPICNRKLMNVLKSYA